MTQEEISLKLGLDSSGFASGVRSIKGQIADFAEHNGRAFEHSAKASRGFKKALEEIADTSPVMGAALKLAISPIGGMLAIATSAFVYFKGKIEETNKELDRLSELAAKPVGNMPEAMNKAREKVAEVAREQKKWWDNVIQSQDDATRGLKDHLSTLDAQAKLSDKILSQEKEKSLYAIKAKEAAGLLTPYEAAVQTQRVEQDYAKRNYNQQLGSEKARQAFLSNQAEDFQTKRAEAEERIDQLELKQKQQAASATTENLPGQLAALKDPAEAARRLKDQDKAREDYDKAAAALAEAQAAAEQNRAGGLADAFQQNVIAKQKEDFARAKQAYDAATDSVHGLSKSIKETQDAIYKRGNEEKNTAEELASARGEYEKYEAARKTAEEGAKQAGTNVVLLTKEGAPFVPPAEPKRGMFNPTLEQFANTPNPNQRDARRAMKIPNEAIQARLRGDNTGADKLESEYNDLMFGKETDMFGETTGNGPINGPPPAGGAGSTDEWNKNHGIAYHSLYDEKTKLGGKHRTGGLQGLLNGQKKDYLEELYKLLSSMSVGGGDKGSKLRIQPAMEK